jgi:PhnB protein
MKIHAYLTFNGQCEEAFKFYADCLNGSLGLMRFGGNTGAENVPEQFHERFVQVRLTSGDKMLMAADSIAGMAY